MIVSALLLPLSPSRQSASKSPPERDACAAESFSPLRGTPPRHGQKYIYGAVAAASHLHLKASVVAHVARAHTPAAYFIRQSAATLIASLLNCRASIFGTPMMRHAAFAFAIFKRLFNAGDERSSRRGRRHDARRVNTAQSYWRPERSGKSI